MSFSHRCVYHHKDPDKCQALLFSLSLVSKDLLFFPSMPMRAQKATQQLKSVFGGIL